MNKVFSGFLIVCLILFSAACANKSVSKVSTSSEIAAIQKVLADQEGAWNKGDLEGYMQGYWKNDSLSFIGKSGITYGWQQTLNNYKRSYPDLKSMGNLSFTILKTDLLGPKSAYVTGKWHLKREDRDLQGYFSLLWKKIDNRWVIVSDHSS